MGDHLNDDDIPFDVVAPKPLSFPLEVLPSKVRDFVREASRAIGCDPSYVALPLLACLARAIGNTRTIKLKRTWTEPAIIWAAMVGKSGTHKSPALAIATACLARKQAEAMVEFKEAMATYEVAKEIYLRDLSKWKHAKKSDGPDDNNPPWEPEQPKLRRYIVGDITTEAMADRMSGQSDGLLVVRDELAGWLDGIGEYKGGKGSDTGHWLATWSAAPLTVDRKGGDQKTLHIPRAAVSIVGGIQPGILQRAIGREHLHDGLCARLLLTMPEPRPVKWTEAVVSPATEAELSTVFEGLFALESAAEDDGTPTPFPLALTIEAQAAWVAYYNRHRAEMADLDDDLASAWSKLEAYAARFALIFQCCSAASREATADVVDEVSIMAGIALSDWFGSEAKRVYGMFVESEHDGYLRELSNWIAKRGGQCTARDLQRGPRKYRQDADEADRVLCDLVNAGYGTWRPVPTTARGGHPTRTFCLLDVATVTEPS